MSSRHRLSPDNNERPPARVDDDSADSFAYLDEDNSAWLEWKRDKDAHPPLARVRSRRSFVALGIAALGGVACGAVPYVTEGRFYPGTAVEDLDISQRSRADALAALKERYAPFENTAVDFVFEQQRWNASLATLGYTIDYNATLDSAFQHGRDGTVFDRYAGVLLETDRRSYPIIVRQTDASALDTFVSQMGSEIIGAARDARLYLSQGEVKILPNQDGRKLDAASARSDTDHVVMSGKRGTVTLRAVAVVSQVTEADYEPAKKLANTLISAPMTVTARSTSWTVDRDTLISALKLPAEGEVSDPYLDTTILRKAIDGIGAEVRTEPKNARYGWDNGLVVLENDVKGQEANLDQLAKDIASGASHSDNRSISLPMNDVLAEARSDNGSTLGIVEAVAQGTSSFAESSEARAANVRVSADHLTHTLIAPGEVVSFNDTLGPISLENGFVEGKIIKGNWVTSDIGGGACQASTTVFRAALFAGLPIDEWHYHAFRLAFYEQDGSPPGLDAAIYQPNDESEASAELDLTFTNDTGKWMLMEMDTSGETARCTLYGTRTGINVDVKVPYVSDPIQPKGPLETEDSKLAKGDRQQIQSAKPGYDVQMVRTITGSDGAVLDTQEFWSRYQPQRETWAIGPGTKREFPVDSSSSD